MNNVWKKLWPECIKRDTIRDPLPEIHSEILEMGNELEFNELS